MRCSHLVCVLLTLTLTFTIGCGRAGYDPAKVANDAAAVDGSSVRIDAALGVASPIFYVDATNVDRAGTAGAQDCPASASSEWSDLASGAVGNLLGFGLPPCSPSGWTGTGSPADPHRLSLVPAGSSGARFGTIAEASQFTVQAWIRWSGGGNPVTTGTGGFQAYPLVAKGTSEEEITEIDENYYLAISAASGTVAGDFEDSLNHDNHPLIGVTPLVVGDWYHLAMTYDQVEQTLLVNGVIDAASASTDPVSLAVDSYLGVGAVFESSGLSDDGFFEGDIAIVRIFDRALSRAEVLVECEAFAGRFEGLNCGP